VPEGVERYLYPTTCGAVLGSLDMRGVRGSEIADRLAKDGSVERFVGPEPFLGGRGGGRSLGRIKEVR